MNTPSKVSARRLAAYESNVSRLAAAIAGHTAAVVKPVNRNSLQIHIAEVPSTLKASS